MIIDITQYFHQTPTIVKLYKKDRSISEISMSTMIPIIAILGILYREYGLLDGMKDHITDIIDFYQYTEIKGLDLQKILQEIKEK